MTCADSLIKAALAENTRSLLREDVDELFSISTGDEGHFHVHSIGDKAGKPADKPSATTYSVKANPDAFDPKFLNYVFQHAHSSGKFKKFLKGTTIQRVTVSDMKHAMGKHLMDLYGDKK